MSHFIAYALFDGKLHYLTPRRATERFYQSRSGWEEGLDNAKVFNTKAAATNSARQATERGEEFTVIPVRVLT